MPTETVGCPRTIGQVSAEYSPGEAIAPENFKCRDKHVVAGVVYCGHWPAERCYIFDDLSVHARTRFGGSSDHLLFEPDGSASKRALTK